MAAGSQPVASGVVQYVVFSIAPVLVLWLVLHAGPIGRFGRRTVSRLWAVRPPLVLAGPPLEQIAATIRRIAAAIETMPAQAPLAQRHGALLAYDDALVAACRALGVEEQLTGMPLGPARHAERLRIECELQYEGLVIDSTRGGVIRAGGAVTGRFPRRETGNGLRVDQSKNVPGTRLTCTNADCACELQINTPCPHGTTYTCACGHPLQPIA